MDVCESSSFFNFKENFHNWMDLVEIYTIIKDDDQVNI